MRASRAIMCAGAAAGLAGAVFLTGCQPGHGKHTEAFRQQAELNMARVKAATEFDMAKQQYRAGDLKKALSSVETSLALDPSQSQSQVLRGRILFEMDRLEAAMGAFDRAAELDPQSAEAHYYRGVVFERFTNFEQANNAFSRAADLDQNNSQFALAAAEMLIQLDRYDEAEALLQQGAARFEHNAGMRQTLGHIAMIRGETDRAVKLFQEACLLAPADEALMEDLARAQIRAGEFGEAEYTLSRLLRGVGVSERRDLAHLRARCLIELDRPVEARTILLELVSDARGASDARAWEELGNVAILLGEYRRVKQCGQRLAALAPHRETGYVLTALFLQHAGDVDGALVALERGMKMADRPVEAAVLASALYERLGRRDAALEAARVAVRSDPNDPRARSVLDSLTADAQAGSAIADVPLSDD